jgi:hypothetical protein
MGKHADKIMGTLNAWAEARKAQHRNERDMRDITQTGAGRVPARLRIEQPSPRPAGPEDRKARDRTLAGKARRRARQQRAR